MILIHSSDRVESDWYVKRQRHSQLNVKISFSACVLDIWQVFLRVLATVDRFPRKIASFRRRVEAPEEVFKLIILRSLLQ